MIEWKRVKAGEYESEDKRFYIVKDIVKLYNSWALIDGDIVYYRPTLYDCKRKAESIVKSEETNELQIQCYLTFKTKKDNAGEAIEELRKAVKRAGINIGEQCYGTLIDDKGRILAEFWD